MSRQCIACGKAFTGSSRDALTPAIVNKLDAVRSGLKLHRPRKGAKWFCHLRCLARVNAIADKKEHLSLALPGGALAVDITSDDMLKVIAARCACNNADAFAIAMPWLSLETFNKDDLFRDLKAFGTFCTGVSSRALNWQLKWKDEDGPDGMLWGAVCFLDKCVVPQLRGGLLERCVRAGACSTSTTVHTNAAVEGVLHGALGMPPLVQSMVLGDIHHLSKGRLWSLEFDFSVTEGALGGLDSVMPKSGSPESRLRLLLQPYKDLRHPALAALLPPEYPRSLIHKLCELRKLDQRLEDLERHPPRNADHHRRMASSTWHLLSCPQAVELPDPLPKSPLEKPLESIRTGLPGICNPVKFARLCYVREALEYDDVLRFFGQATAWKVWPSLSDQTKALYLSKHFQNMRRCRSDPRLDRTSSAIYNSTSVARTKDGHAKGQSG